jgi:hypothetical protein
VPRRSAAAGAGARRCSPVMEGVDKPVEAVLGRCSPAGDGGVAERWCTGGHERRRLELIARAKESVKELLREGMRCDESWESHRPFIGAGGSTGEGWPGE